MTGLQRAVLTHLANSDVHDLNSLNAAVFARKRNLTTRTRIARALNALRSKGFAEPVEGYKDVWTATDRGRKV